MRPADILTPLVHSEKRGSNKIRMRHVHRCEGCRGRAAEAATSTLLHKRLMPREKWRPTCHRSASAMGGKAAWWLRGATACQVQLHNNLQLRQSVPI
ncbi:uncharacterized protein LOC120321983 [Drosophila yakuba]|uniref:uncharacterized protein LOC120321983 n=1 Tax=Drosophila yakuba TaxID=7245 RepID=UPI00193077C9|nr:uncharacterized protein LOC120321983 [Drosophila yakuba]